MRKKLILFLTVFLSCVLFGCNMNINDIEEIEIVNSSSKERQVFSKDTQTAKDILTGVEKLDKTDESISNLTKYEILLNGKNKKEAYIMSFDVENKSVFVSKDNTNYKLKDNIAQKILNDNAFSYIYVDNTIPKVSLYQNDTLSDVNIQYDWSFKKIDGSEYDKSGMIGQEENEIKINKNDKIKLDYSSEPDSQSIKVYSHGEVIKTGKNISDIISEISNDGEYYFEAEAKWNKKNGRDYSGSQIISFTAKIDIPAVINVLSKENYPGNIMIVFIENLNENELVKLETEAVKGDVNVFSYEDKKVAMLPIDLWTIKGEYVVKAVFNEGMSNEYINTQVVTINNKEFKTQYLTISDEIASSTDNDESNQEYVAYVKKARSVSSDEKLWQGEFLRPVEGVLTTDFAEIRYVNDSVSSERHSGIDLATKKGTPVSAPNSGKVALAKETILTGNTIVIDHGLGLFTSYYHLDSMTVKTGDLVEKSQIIGNVGTTGFSTGPHLHYAVSIYNTYVNTYQPFGGLFD